MDAARLEAYRKQLLEKRDEILSRVRAIRAAETASAGGRAADFVDRAAEEGSRDILYSLGTNERILIQRIDAALNRVASGEYGQCAHCGKPVQKARLDAVPWALHCIECQELQDRGEI